MAAAPVPGNNEENVAAKEKDWQNASCEKQPPTVAPSTQRRKSPLSFVPKVTEDPSHTV